MQKRVIPAEPTASIPDPHRGDSLPPKGRVVDWNAYWAGLVMRADVTVEDAPETIEAPAEPEPEPEPADHAEG